MLSIRLQRTGRKGHAQYRVVVQESRLSPTSGKFVAHLGHYNPHTKTSVINKEKADFYLKNGAQPSDRIVKLFSAEKIKLPSWVSNPADKKRQLRNPEKLRKNQPKEEAKPETAKELSDATVIPEKTKEETPESKTEQS